MTDHRTVTVEGMRGLFWARVERGAPEDCWPWQGHRRRDGYGALYHARRAWPAHRVAYELLVGPIPDGLQLDHLCRNRACVNPAHLEPVTNRENVLRGIGVTALNAAKQTCRLGHPYVNDVIPRHCLECARAKMVRYRQRKRLQRSEMVG